MNIEVSACAVTQRHCPNTLKYNQVGKSYPHNPFQQHCHLLLALSFAPWFVVIPQKARRRDNWTDRGPPIWYRGLSPPSPLFSICVKTPKPAEPTEPTGLAKLG